MKTTNVDVPVAIDTVFQALVQGLALLWGGEDSRYSRRDRGILLSQSTEFSLSNSLSLGADRTEGSRHSKLLGGWGGIARSISRHDPRSRLSVSHASKERRTRGRLGGSGGVRTTAVFKSRQVSKTTLHPVRVRGRSSRGVRDHVGAVGACNAALMHVVTSGDARTVDRIRDLGHSHVVRSLDVAAIARVDDRGVSGHVAARRNGNRRSALGNVIISQAESAERTDKTAKAIMMGSWIVNATGPSNIMSSLSSHVSRSHAVARSLVVGIGSHSGVIVVRHCGFYMVNWLALTSIQNVEHERRCENTSRDELQKEARTSPSSQSN